MTVYKRIRRRLLRLLMHVLMRLVLAVVLLSLVLVLPWRWINPPSSSFILQDALRSERDIEHDWIPIEEISPWLAISIIAAEDQKFPHHHGFDFDQIQAALSQVGARPPGASTLTQQLAKNLYLWSGRSYIRKGLEAYLTLWIEGLWSKHRILEIYLNIVEFGPGVYGADAASRIFFHRQALQLTPKEAALLAAVLPNPKKMSAQNPSYYVQHRALQIEEAVSQLGGPAYLSSIEERE